MHSDCCQGPVQVLRCAVAVLFLRILFPRRMLSTRITCSNTHEAKSGTQATILCLSSPPRLERNKRNHFVLNDAIDLSIQSHLLSFLLRSTRRSFIDLATWATRLSARGYDRDKSPSSREATPVRSADWTTGKPPRGGPYHAEVPLLSLCRFPSSLSLSLLCRLPSPISCSQPRSHPSLYTPSTLFPSVFLFYSFIPFLSRSPLPVFILPPFVLLARVTCPDMLVSSTFLSL